MQITKQLRGETVELKIEGRVDGYWADHLAAAVDQEIRQGSHHIQLDLSQVAFLSSVGIGTLVRLYKDLKSIQGSFSVSNCSRNVLKVIQLSKLEDVLVAKVMPESLPTNESRQSFAVEAPAPTSIRQVSVPEPYTRSIHSIPNPSKSAADGAMPPCSNAAVTPNSTAAPCNSPTPLSRSD